MQPDLPKMFYTYILKSLKDNRYYFGHTENLWARISYHNAGKVSSTKSRRPLEIIYYEIFADRSGAYKREMFFKSYNGRIWLIEQKIIVPLK